MILIVIAMIIKITSGWIFNLCFWLFVDRKITIYFSYLIIACIFTIYILFGLNWIIKWINLNTVNLIIHISEFSCFFNDDDKFMLIISFETTKLINLYRFKIHIFYGKLALYWISAQIYYFHSIYNSHHKAFSPMFFKIFSIFSINSHQFNIHFIE